MDGWVDGLGRIESKAGRTGGAAPFQYPERRIGKLGTGKRSPDPMSGSGNAGGSRGRNRFTSSSNLHFLRPRSCFSKQHGLLTVERGRAGSDVEDFGEEAGSVLLQILFVTLVR